MADVFARGVKPALLIHGSHHKMGTVYVHTVLERICAKHGLCYLNGVQSEVSAQTDFLFQNQGRFDLDALPPFRGTHVVRDLRDVVISGYDYHKWTHEGWAHTPMTGRELFKLKSDEKLAGEITYQQLLTGLDPEEGIAIEMRRLAIGVAPDLQRWDFDDPRFLELRFEDLRNDPVPVFRQMFEWYGFQSSIVDAGAKIARQRSLEQISTRPIDERPPHTRSGGSRGAWQDRFTTDTKREFKTLMGPLLIKLGYADDETW